MLVPLKCESFQDEWCVLFAADVPRLGSDLEVEVQTSPGGRFRSIPGPRRRYWIQRSVVRALLTRIVSVSQR